MSTVCRVRLFCVCVLLFFVFKQKTAYEMLISDWSSDVCSSDLANSVVGLITLGVTARPEARQIVAQLHALGIAQVAILTGDARGPAHAIEIGRASCRERVCQFVYHSVVA